MGFLWGFKWPFGFLVLRPVSRRPRPQVPSFLVSPSPLSRAHASHNRAPEVGKRKVIAQSKRQPARNKSDRPGRGSQLLVTEEECLQDTVTTQ